MKLSAGQWCKIQEALVNLKCPHCFSSKVELTANEKENASCVECGCKFEFDPDIALRWE